MIEIFLKTITSLEAKRKEIEKNIGFYHCPKILKLRILWLTNCRPTASETEGFMAHL